MGGFGLGLMPQVLFTVSIMFSCYAVRSQLFGDQEPGIASLPLDEEAQPVHSFFVDGSSRGDGEDLTVQETRHKNRRQSYNRRSKPVHHQYNTQTHHSDHKGSKGKDGKGGYETSGSYKGKKGHSTYDSFDRASKDKYADSNHKKYGGQGGNQYGHGKGGHGGKHHSAYTRDVEDYY